jgi:hypothetical protein
MNEKHFNVYPLRTGEFVVVINGPGANPHDPESKWAIVWFASEQEAERWAKNARAGNEGPEPREVAPGVGYDEFWQDIADLAYMLDNEHVDYRRKGLEAFLGHFPEPDPRASFEDYRRYAVHRLLSVWLAGPDPLAESEEQRATRLTESIRTGQIINSPRAEAFLKELGAEALLKAIDAGTDPAAGR